MSWQGCLVLVLAGMLVAVFVCRAGEISELHRNQTDKFPVKEIAAFEAGGLILKTDNRDRLCVSSTHGIKFLAHLPLISS